MASVTLPWSRTAIGSTLPVWRFQSCLPALLRRPYSTEQLEPTKAEKKAQWKRNAKVRILRGLDLLLGLGLTRRALLFFFLLLRCSQPNSWTRSRSRSKLAVAVMAVCPLLEPSTSSMARLQEARAVPGVLCTFE